MLVRLDCQVSTVYYLLHIVAVNELVSSLYVLSTSAARRLGDLRDVLRHHCCARRTGR